MSPKLPARQHSLESGLRPRLPFLLCVLLSLAACKVRTITKPQSSTTMRPVAVYSQHGRDGSVPTPEYPDSALKTHAEGRALVVVMVSGSEQVSAWIRTSSGCSLLDSAACAAARRGRFAGRGFERRYYHVAFEFSIIRVPGFTDSAVSRVRRVALVAQTPESSLQTAADTIRVGGARSPMQAVVRLPVYPVMACHAGISGSPTVTVIVGQSGTIDTCWVSASSGNQTIDGAAQGSARQLAFTGTRALQRAAPARYEIIYAFTAFRTQGPATANTRIGSVRVSSVRRVE